MSLSDVRRQCGKVLLVLLIIFCAGGCRQAKPKNAEGKLSVVSLIFPSWDFVRVIAGDRVNLVMLLPPGAESHSYEPSPRDIIAIKNSDLFIYSGGESTKWADRILESLDDSGEILNGRMKLLKLMDLVHTVEEEIVEGMEDDEGDDDKGENKYYAYDEHVWTSPGNAKAIALAICESLCALDPANEEFFRRNTAEYVASLDELDASFRAVVKDAKRNVIIFGDRFPFRYLADAYGLKYFAAFPGCSAEAEPSAATVAFLINKVKDENIPVVFHIELSNEKMADAIAEAAGAGKLLLHSCHTVTRKEFENGANYLDLQKANVEHLREALR